MWEGTGRSEVSERDNSGEKSNHRSTGKCVHVQAGTNVAHVSRCYSQRVCKSDREKIGLLRQMQDKVIEINSGEKMAVFTVLYIRRCASQC